jgi:hypothetical protein
MLLRPDELSALLLEVDFEGFDEGEEPSEQLLVDGVVVVGIEGVTVGELHDSAQFVTMGAGRDVVADVGFDETGDLALQGPDLANDALFLIFSDSGFPAECEGVDDHEEIVNRRALEWDTRRVRR